MSSRSLLVPGIALLALTGGAVGLTAARRGPTVERVDFDKVARATSPAFDARLAPVSDADVKEFRIASAGDVAYSTPCTTIGEA